MRWERLLKSCISYLFDQVKVILKVGFVKKGCFNPTTPTTFWISYSSVLSVSLHS